MNAFSSGKKYRIFNTLEKRKDWCEKLHEMRLGKTHYNKFIILSK